MIRNRICVPPMVVYNWSDGSGYVDDKHVEHYRQLAHGGAGLIIQEATCVTAEGQLAQTQLGIWEDGQIAGLRRITQAVHAEGCPIFVQIHHAGIVGIAEHALISWATRPALRCLWSRFMQSSRHLSVRRSAPIRRDMTA